jgi:hypothetical protein
MKMIAVCGLDCASCPARLAHLNNDDILREKTAAEWSALFGADIKPEDVNCTGCTDEGIKFPHCENTCFMRKCAMEKELDSCASCTDFPCNQLSELFTHAPEAEENLRSLRT